MTYPIPLPPLHQEKVFPAVALGQDSLHLSSDVSGRAQSPEPGPARPSKARPEAGLGSGFQQAWAWLEVQKAQSPGLKPRPHNQLRKYVLNS